MSNAVAPGCGACRPCGAASEGETARSDGKAVCEAGVTWIKEDCGSTNAATVDLMIASGAWAAGLSCAFACCAGWGRGAWMSLPWYLVQSTANRTMERASEDIRKLNTPKPIDS
jgi:hypothetical protein